MRIRKATHADVAACAKIQRASAEKSVHWSGKDELLARKYLHRYLSNDYSAVLVAEDESKIVDHVAFTYDGWNNSMHVDLLFVRPDKQKQGVGSKLIDEVVSCAKKQDMRIIFLETNKTENDAIIFYEKNGFSIAGHIDGL